MLPRHDRWVLCKLKVVIIVLKDERQYIPHQTGNNAEISCLTISIQHYIESPRQWNKRQKEEKTHRLEKEKYICTYK